jgi:hypothetical protein
MPKFVPGQFAEMWAKIAAQNKKLKIGFWRRAANLQNIGKVIFAKIRLIKKRARNLKQKSTNF